MKVFLALFICGLLISPSLGAIILLDSTVVTLKCLVSVIGGSSCDLLSVLNGTPGPGDSLNLDASLFGAVSISLSSALTITDISFAAASGSVLNITSGAVLTASGALTVGASTTVSVYGQVTAAGKSTVASAAAFVIAAGGSATFNGGVSVNAGASGANQGLVVNGNARLTIAADSQIDGALNLAANSVFVVQSGVVTVSNDVVSAGNTTVQSTLYVSSSTAAYTQSQGNLILSSTASTTAVVNANVAIAANSYLKGTGNVTGNLNIQTSADASTGGTIAPGNSPGTVYVNGDFALTSTSTFELEIASASSYDRVIVRGNAAINGILACKLLNNFQPNSGDQYTFITSGGAVSGKFNIVRGDFNSNIGKFTQTENPHTVVATYNGAGAVTASLFLMVVCVVIALLTL